MTILPHAPWRDHPGLARLVAALGQGNARLVGGAVRDTLLGHEAADIDVATPLVPEEAARLLEAAGIKVVPTGIDHGTLTAVSDDLVVEVTTLRRDVTTDGRRATVAFTTDWAEDAGRRDFTINALYADPISGEVFDWFGGIDDLEAGRVRFIGDPYARIAEDHLRILRFFRFDARFGDTMDDASVAACIERAGDLAHLSVERIAAETLKLLVAPGAVGTMRLMVERGILAAVLPEIGADGVGRLARLAGREAAYGIKGDAVRRLAALVPSHAADEVARRLKLSTAQRERLVAATRGIGGEGLKGLAYRAGEQGATDRLLVAGIDPTPIIGWEAPRMPVKGGDLIAMGLPRGPVVAETLRAVEDRWVAEGFPDERRTREIAADRVGQVETA